MLIDYLFRVERIITGHIDMINKHKRNDHKMLLITCNINIFLVFANY